MGFLATLPAGRRTRRLAWSMVLVSLAGFLIAAPLAKTPLTPVTAMLPAYEAALILSDLVTTALLLGQYSILRSNSLLVLASGYLYTALIAAVHAATFPGVFAPHGVLGGGPQTTAWLYMFWHGGFPLFVVGYAMCRRREAESDLDARHPARLVAVSSLGVLALVAVFALVATAGEDVLPPVMEGDHYTAVMIEVVGTVWFMIVASISMVWRATRSPSVLDVWLVVVMCAWFFDVALSAVLNAGRYDLGFYAGRLYGLVAAVLVLLMLLVENSRLYLSLVQAHERERQRAAELFEVNRELDAFSFSVSHDLRAPLYIIDGFAKAIEEDYRQTLGSDGMDLLDGVRSTTKRLVQLVDNLLVFSRFGRQELNKSAVDLAELVRTVISELRLESSSSSITIQELGVAHADPALLKQVFINLLGNAVKYSRKRPDPAIEVGRIDLLGDGNGVYFVKDNGAGFDMKYAEKLFGVFQRLHSREEFEGTGVGLAIVQRIIHRHGGHIWAESSPGAGATFLFTLKPSPVPTHAGRLNLDHGVKSEVS